MVTQISPKADLVSPNVSSSPLTIEVSEAIDVVLSITTDTCPEEDTNSIKSLPDIAPCRCILYCEYKTGN